MSADAIALDAPGVVVSEFSDSTSGPVRWSGGADGSTEVVDEEKGEGDEEHGSTEVDGEVNDDGDDADNDKDASWGDDAGCDAGEHTESEGAVTGDEDEAGGALSTDVSTEVA
ncbi:hypothetical protein CF319_g9003 [Tilletia indica]|nr:hypothetical protein CF319_g9003 [Tilletia indica]